MRIPTRTALVLAVALIAAAQTPLALASPPFEPEAMRIRSCPMHPDEAYPTTGSVPAGLAALMEEHLGDERLRGVGLGVSIWMEGFGEIVSVNPGLRLRPASNQKILTAIGALEFIGSDSVYVTTVSATDISSSGAAGDLYLIGGGDPTLRSSGSHSLESLADLVTAAGVRRVDGDLVIDETRYDRQREANGWGDYLVPRWAGSMSALVVDENAWISDVGFIAEPALANGILFLEALADRGVMIGGEVRLGAANDGAVAVASVESAPTTAIVRTMLTDSNNTYAELVLKEVGLQATGVGSTSYGLRAIDAFLTDRCLETSIGQRDGSGLSDGNARTATNWRILLQAIQTEPWFEEFRSSLAVAGLSGTLLGRFRTTAAQGNLVAKTGSITGLRALSGYLTTESGRAVVFSAIVDADEPRVPMRAIDDFLVAIAEFAD